MPSTPNPSELQQQFVLLLCTRIAPMLCHGVHHRSLTIADGVHRKLEQALAPTVLKVTNDSHKHAGHSGNPSGAPDAETHFRVEVTTEDAHYLYNSRQDSLLCGCRHSCILED